MNSEVDYWLKMNFEIYEWYFIGNNRAEEARLLARKPYT